jgi:hypothetical protein
MGWISSGPNVLPVFFAGIAGMAIFEVTALARFMVPELADEDEVPPDTFFRLAGRVLIPEMLFLVTMKTLCHPH